jgi:photosystem II stability/assembly factor-like uncharacterized protein
MIRYAFLSVAVAAGLATLGIGAWAIAVPVSDWKIAGPFGGTAMTVGVDPQNPKTVLAGARSSLLFRSQDFGDNWEPLNIPRRNLGEVTSVVIDPIDPNHYLAGMLDAFGGGLYESPDAGKTWNAVKDLLDLGVRALAVSPSNPSEFVAGTLKGVMLSTDSGKSWTRISDPNNLEMQGITSLAVDSKDANIIYAGTSHLPWKTVDAGKTWESIHSGMIDDSDVFSIYVDPAQPTNVFASACSGIYASLNRGDSWRKLAGIPNTSRRTHVIREDLTQPNVIYAGTTTGLFKSANAGVNWKTVSNTQVNSIAFDPLQPKNMYLAMEYEGVGKTDDGGETIKPVNNGFVDRQISAVTVSGSKFVAVEAQGGEGTSIFVSADKGETWVQSRNPRGLAGAHLRFVVGTPNQERLLFAATSHQVYKSIDGGNAWLPYTIRMIVKPPVEAPKAAAPVAKGPARSRAATAAARRPVKPRVILRNISPSEINGLYAVKNGDKDMLFIATNLGLFKSIDEGSQWSQLELNGATDVSSFYSGPTAEGWMAARTSAGLYLSKDCGDHWERLAFPTPPVDINDVAIPYGTNARLLVATRVGLYSSSDGGDNWLANSGELKGSTVNSVIYRAATQTAYAVQYGQLFQSSDGGNSWSMVRSALPSLQIRQLWVPDNTSDRLYGITSGLGILFRN